MKTIYLKIRQNFFTTLIDYLKDVLSDVMSDTCELVFVAFFGNLKHLMMKSMTEERQRFSDLNEQDLTKRSHLRVFVVSDGQVNKRCGKRFLPSHSSCAALTYSLDHPRRDFMFV